MTAENPGDLWPDAAQPTHPLGRLFEEAAAEVAAESGDVTGFVVIEPADPAFKHDPQTDRYTFTLNIGDRDLGEGQDEREGT